MNDHACGLPSCVTHLAWLLMGALMLAAWAAWPDARNRYRWRG